MHFLSSMMICRSVNNKKRRVQSFWWSVQQKLIVASVTYLMQMVAYLWLSQLQSHRRCAIAGAPMLVVNTYCVNPIFFGMLTLRNFLKSLKYLYMVILWLLCCSNYDVTHNKRIARVRHVIARVRHVFRFSFFPKFENVFVTE